MPHIVLCLPSYHGYGRAWFVTAITPGVLLVVVGSDERQDGLRREWCVENVK
jgi:hypothetical protein